ncbi:hypothetical protein GGR34_002057 [Microvirga flocculans]|uniref:Uncharacterized protein n=1 Tax=Microvirga flocculans TaxID=217168 RepID=A0A7W6IFK3_9HYPH|nr:hypothetical protein [Microvirga flocculans]MBB4040404.1 hypothetical protein [Microvirga flocculans]
MSTSLQNASSAAGRVSAPRAAGLPDRPMVAEPVEARFDPATRQTFVQGTAGSDLCFAFALPDEWRASPQGLTAALTRAEISVGLRSAEALRHVPRPDLVSRDAAVLQNDYEELLGRPAQSVSLTPGAGGARWSATWIDANLPSASHSMTVETLIMPLSPEWVLELSLSGVETPEDYNILIRNLWMRLKVQGAAACRE